MATQNRRIWELLKLRIAEFEKWRIWEMQDLRIAKFENSRIWEIALYMNLVEMIELLTVSPCSEGPLIIFWCTAPYFIKNCLYTLNLAILIKIAFFSICVISYLCTHPHVSQNLRFSKSAFLKFCDSQILHFSNPAILKSCNSQILQFSNPALLKFCISQILQFSNSVILIFCDLGSPPPTSW